MLHFYYGYMKPKYGDNFNCLYSDTDSYVFEVITEDLYQDIYNDKHLFDLSDVKIKKFQDNTNKKVLGKLKCETGFIPILEFCSLAPKLYSFITQNRKNKKIGKGISKQVLRDSLTHENYKHILTSNETITKPQINIRSKNHVLFTTIENKKTLTSYDNKMHRNGDVNLPFGHYMLNQTR